MGTPYRIKRHYLTGDILAKGEGRGGLAGNLCIYVKKRSLLPVVSQKNKKKAIIFVLKHNFMSLKLQPDSNGVKLAARN